ncbi:MAG: SagB family peptide dehydrogenase [Pseudomonadota bacterium]
MADLEKNGDDFSGTHLHSPNESWESVTKFLMKTRTGANEDFTISGDDKEIQSKLANARLRTPTYYERVGVPFIQLTKPALSSDKENLNLAFEDVLLSRRTTRRFSTKPMSETQLSTLLYLGWGATSVVKRSLGDLVVRKTSPSSGSIHPVEVYPVIMNVEGIPQGLYHYSVRRHGLEEVSQEDPREWITHAIGDQRWVAEAGVVFLISAFLPRVVSKYDHPRSARAVFSEVGFSSQSAFLAATWQGLGAFHTILLRDEVWEKKLGLDPRREPVFGVTGAGTLEAHIDDHTRPRYETVADNSNS